MKTIYFILLTVFLATACVKPVESNYQFTDLTIVQTTTPPAIPAVSQRINSLVRVSGPDLCYKFAYFAVYRQDFLIDIQAVGTYPTKPTGCALAVYYADTTLSIPVTATGQYILRFYNKTQLFKADTVQVN